MKHSSNANPLAPSHRPTLTLARKHQPIESHDADRRQVYNSARWRYTVQPAKRKRDPLCQWCAYEGVLKPMKHVDHWRPLAQGGAPYDDANLVSLCHSHHSRKTALEQAGKPLPPIMESAVQKYSFA